MSAKGYCTVPQVAEFLGLEMTAAQAKQCQAIIERVEYYIDTQTGRGWVMGAQTDEAHYLNNQTDFIFLKYAPISSVTTITGRSWPGGTETTLTANTDYEVRNLTTGLIRVISKGYDRLLVDYTPSSTVPGDLVQATIELVANWLQPHLQPGSYGLDSYSLPDLTVKYSRAHVQEVAPPAVQMIIDSYRYRVYA